MKWLLLTLICALLGLPAAAFGQQTIERQYKAKPDTSINVGIFSSINKDCTAAPLPVIRLVIPPAHGKVTVKQGRLRATNLKECLGTELPAFVMGSGGKAQFQKITVTVMKPGSGQGI
jgi:hypothetical protein